MGVIYGYRPYSYFINGAKTEATGRVTSVNLLSSEVIFNNPAFLTESLNSIVYEFNADIGFKGFTTDYRLSFDLGNLGYLFSKKKNGKVDHYAISYSTLFKSDVLENISEITTPNLSIRQFGFSHGFKMGPYFSLGYTIGIGIAIDSSLGFLNSFFTLSPTAKLGIIVSLNENILIGALISLPMYLNWNFLSNYDLVEWTPFYVSTGMKIRLSPNVTLLSEINYQSWDTSSYKLQGTHRYIDRGNSAFDYGQNLFLNLGLYIHGKTKQNQSHLQESNQLAKKIKDEIKNINEQLSQLNKEIKNNRFLDNLNSQVEKEFLELLEREKRLKKNIRSLILKEELSPQSIRELSSIKKQIVKKNKEIKAILQEKENDLILFGGKKRKRELEEKIDQLNLELTDLNEKAQFIQYGFLSEKEKIVISNGYIELKEISQRKRSLTSEISILKKNEKEVMNEIIKKENRGDLLSGGEYLIYKNQLKKEKLLILRKKKYKELKKIINKNKSPIRGNFYLGYSPEVVYDVNGKFRRIGNLTLGFTFRANNVKNLYFTISLTDRTILRLLQVHPDNDPTEIVKITSSYHFND